MTEKVWAIIDDIRTLNCELIARTARDGIQMVIDNFDRIECLCLDNDLGELVEGYDVLCNLFYMDKVPNKVQLVTSNPVAQGKMSKLLQSNGYKTIDNRNFTKVIE